MFNRVSESNFNKISLPRESCLVNVSSFKELKTDLLFRSFSIKMVMEGEENYRVDGNQYKVKKGEYLLANNFSGGKLTIESNEPVKGLCIDIAPSILAEVVASYIRPDCTEFDPDLEQFFTTDSYPENKYSLQNTFLGNQLIKISRQISTDTNHKFEFSNEFFYNLAECIVIDQSQLLQQIKSIKSVKQETKKAIFRKIHIAKDFIDINFNTIQSIEEVASFCTMSEYHFFRLFKQVFKISPYQYIQKKKLEYAFQLLKNNNVRVTDVAIMSGFNDLSTFSKSFKRQFGVSPQNQYLI